MSQLSHDRLPFGQSSHLPVRITPAVRTRGWYFQFAFYRLAISQFANYQTRQSRAKSYIHARLWQYRCDCPVVCAVMRSCAEVFITY